MFLAIQLKNNKNARTMDRGQDPAVTIIFQPDASATMPIWLQWISEPATIKNDMFTAANPRKTMVTKRATVVATLPQMVLAPSTAKKNRLFVIGSVCLGRYVNLIEPVR
ncbi:hypothetical protein SCUP515_07053 [Seiridium cupressi]